MTDAFFAPGSDEDPPDSGPHEHLALVGISHHTASFDILERLALSETEIEGVYDHLFDGERVDDALILSTCNRTEIYTHCPPDYPVHERVCETLAEVAGAERWPDPHFLYRVRGKQSVEHLFRVTTGLDSMILGESQILGQVKEAFDRSRLRGRSHPYFERCVQAAFKVGRRSRSETKIGEGAVSVAAAGVHLATRIYRNLSRRTVVVLGAGDTGRLAAEHFSKHNPRRLIVVNRTVSRAADVVGSLGGESYGLDALGRLLPEADILACAVRCGEPIVAPDLVASAMRRRSGRSLAIVDLGLPRNVHSQVHQIPNVFVHDLDALKRVVDGTLAARKKEVPRVESMIQREVDRLLAWQRTARAAPLIAALRSQVETMRQAEVKRATPGLESEQREAVDRATRAVVNKLLHGPMSSIKQFAQQQEEGAERLALIKEIFSNLDLDDRED